MRQITAKQIITFRFSSNGGGFATTHNSVVEFLPGNRIKAAHRVAKFSAIKDGEAVYRGESHLPSKKAGERNKWEIRISAGDMSAGLAALDGVGQTGITEARGGWFPHNKPGKRGR